MLCQSPAAVSCSADGAMLGGVGLGSGTTGKQRRAWHRCMVLVPGGVPGCCGVVLGEVW